MVPERGKMFRGSGSYNPKCPRTYFRVEQAFPFMIKHVSDIHDILAKMSHLVALFLPNANVLQAHVHIPIDSPTDKWLQGDTRKAPDYYVALSCKQYYHCSIRWWITLAQSYPSKM